MLTISFADEIAFYASFGFRLGSSCLSTIRIFSCSTSSPPPTKQPCYGYCFRLIRYQTLTAPELEPRLIRDGSPHAKDIITSANSHDGDLEKYAEDPSMKRCRIICLAHFAFAERGSQWITAILPTFQRSLAGPEHNSQELAEPLLMAPLLG